MERFYCYLAGFAIALALIAGFLIVKRVVEDHKEQTERKMRDIAIEEVLKEREYIEKIIAIKGFCYGGSKLAEKEGEHEGDRC